MGSLMQLVAYGAQDIYLTGEIIGEFEYSVPLFQKYYIENNEQKIYIGELARKKSYKNCQLENVKINKILCGSSIKVLEEQITESVTITETCSYNITLLRYYKFFLSLTIKKVEIVSKNPVLLLFRKIIKYKILLHKNKIPDDVINKIIMSYIL